MRRIVIKLGLFVSVLLFSVVVASAQEPGPGELPMPQDQPRPAIAPHPHMDPLGELMFPPEIIMQHQRELGLTDEQKTFMRGEINRATARFNDLQWQLQDQMEALHDTMKANPVNEQQAMAQLDKVLDTEREIKRLHMELAIRIKNRLTPEQQEKLHQGMRMMGPMPEGGPGRGRVPGRGPDSPPPGSEQPPRSEDLPRPDGAPIF